MVIRVFASGQSNMMGRGTGGPSWSAVDSRVRVWNNANPLGANGDAFVTATVARTTHGTFENKDRNNLAVWFCHQLTRSLKDDVRLTMVARGATTIESWAPSISDLPMLQECIDVWNATGQGLPADVFLWHQGEGNVSTAPASYRGQFLALIANLKVAGIINDQTMIILGGTAEENQGRINFNTNMLKVLASENAQIRYASPVGLTTSDGTHFDGQSTYVLGAARFFYAYAGEAGIAPEKTYAAVNVGGVPSEFGSGKSGILDITGYRELGIGKKRTADQPTFDGFPNVDGTIMAAMIAAGALVDFGFNMSTGSYLRFESGLQYCWHTDVQVVRESDSSLSHLWMFPAAFKAGLTPCVTWEAVNKAGLSTSSLTLAKLANCFKQIATATAYSNLRASL